MLGSGVGSSMSLVRSSSSSSRATADLRCFDEFTAEVRVLENKGLNVTNNITSADTSNLLFVLFILSQLHDKIPSCTINQRKTSVT